MMLTSFSSRPSPECDPVTGNDFLRLKTRPTYERGVGEVCIADLFAGCGGMTLGVAQAAFELGHSTSVRLALDSDERALETYAANFPARKLILERVEDTFNGDLGEAPTEGERALRRTTGTTLHFLLGGPPCQGHSDLNNHSRRTDPKNSLYDYMARAAEVLRPRVVVIENVPSVVHDRGGVVQETRRALQRLRYLVADGMVDLSRLGVPQTRKRHLLVATSRPLRPAIEYLRALQSTCPQLRTLGWAIGDLESEAGSSPLDQPSRQSEENKARAHWLHDNGEYDLPDALRPPCHRDKSHSYRSVYGRLQWDKPAQTITSGFTSMGQGRFLHPSRVRTLTPHEAARLQYFPDFFNWDLSSRRSLATMIGNAVPPKLTMDLARAIIPDLVIG